MRGASFFKLIYIVCGLGGCGNERLAQCMCIEYAGGGGRLAINHIMGGQSLCAVRRTIYMECTRKIKKKSCKHNFSHGAEVTVNKTRLLILEKSIQFE